MQAGIARGSRPHVRRSSFVRQDHSSGGGRVGALWPLLLLLGVCGAGCQSTGYRLLENFDNEPLGVLPTGPLRVYPSPTPPNDSMQWNQTEPFSKTDVLHSRVAPREGGGRWAVVQPLDGLLSLGQQGLRGGLAVIAESERLKNPDAQVRGHAALRLVGPGIVDVRLHVRGSRDGGYAGGILLMSGAADEVRTTTGAELSDPAHYNLPPPGTPLKRYTPGETVELFWSMDQATRQLNVSVTGAGGPESTQLTFKLSPASNLPGDQWRAFALEFGVYDFTLDTRLFLDDLTLEELK